jgi:hypothetical protein
LRLCSAEQTKQHRAGERQCTEESQRAFPHARGDKQMSAKRAREGVASDLPDSRHVKTLPLGEKPSHPAATLYRGDVARRFARAITMQISCEFSSLCFVEHKILANESTNKRTETSKIHLMS